jgi:DNA-binding NarL/FixJ family response regulator
MSLNLLIVDESEILRMGVRTLVGNKRDWKICGEASNGAKALLKVRDLTPDVVILALTMPLKNDFQTAKELRRLAPSMKIVFLSMHNVPATARESGADAFVLKTSPASEPDPRNRTHHRSLPQSPSQHGTRLARRSAVAFSAGA